MTRASSIVDRLFLATALLALALELALAGHFTSVEYGDDFADLMQNF
jgi:hypothetical protein